MKKILSLTSLLASLFFLTACENMENPSPLDTRSSMGQNEMNPSDLPGDSFGDDSAMLSGRGINDMSNFDFENISPEDILGTIYFGFDQYAVAPSERSKVQEAIAFFQNNPDYVVVLVGHTDWYGTDEYNILLSDKRATAVQDYMMASGFDTSSVETVGRGEAGSILDVTKDSPEATQDRRVDIVKFKK